MKLPPNPSHKQDAEAPIRPSRGPMTVGHLRGLLRATNEALKVQRQYPGAPGEVARAFAFALPHPTPAQRWHAQHRLHRLGAPLHVAVRIWAELEAIRSAA